MNSDTLQHCQIILLQSLKSGYTHLVDFCTIIDNCIKYNPKVLKLFINPDERYKENIILKILWDLIKCEYASKVRRGTYAITEKGSNYLSKKQTDINYLDIIINTVKESDRIAQSIHKAIIEQQDKNITDPIRSKFLQKNGNLKEEYHTSLNCSYNFTVNNTRLHIMTWKDIEIVPGTILSQPDISIETLGPWIDC